NGNCRSGGLGRESCLGTAGGEDDGDLNFDQLIRQGGQSIISALRPTKCDVHVSSLGVTNLFQALTETSHHGGGFSRRPAAEDSDPRHRRLLRARRERPRRGSAEKRDELAPPCMSRKEHCEG